MIDGRSRLLAAVLGRLLGTAGCVSARPRSHRGHSRARRVALGIERRQRRDQRGVEARLARRRARSSRLAAAPRSSFTAACDTAAAPVPGTTASTASTSCATRPSWPTARPRSTVSSMARGGSGWISANPPGRSHCRVTSIDRTFEFFDRDDGESSGVNVLARWTRRPSTESELNLQVYYDRTSRLVPLQLDEQRHTFDVDFDHRRRLSTRQSLSVGAGIRRQPRRHDRLADPLLRPRKSDDQPADGVRAA